jgi:YebC/PmpR family DNA-binding regulatory protein
VETTYEGYGPHGIAFFVEVLTDNTNRSVADIRSMFSKSGGNLGTSGSVAFQFDRKGVIEVKGHVSEDDLFELVAEAGAEDLEKDDDGFTVTTEVESFGSVHAALEKAGIEMDNPSLVRIPTTTMKLPVAHAEKVLRLVDALEDHADVQAVFTTLELDEATISALA